MIGIQGSLAESGRRCGNAQTAAILFWTLVGCRDSDCQSHAMISPVPKPPFSPSVSRGRSAQLLERAAVALRTRQFAEAEQLAAEVLRGSRNDTAAASILARALLALNRGGEAIAPLEKAVRRSSDA